MFLKFFMLFNKIIILYNYINHNNENLKKKCVKYIFFTIRTIENKNTITIIIIINFVKHDFKFLNSFK